MDQLSEQISQLRRYITDEIFRALGMPPNGVPRKVLGPLVWPPANAFAKLSANFDYRVENEGVRSAAAWLLKPFIRSLEVRGIDLVPAEGPLLIASNHPGTVDAASVVANLPREDLKIVASGIPFFREMPATWNCMVHSSLDTNDRMIVVRESIRHLRLGGALLIFPSGGIDPDPAVMKGADEVIDTWSPSIELLLRKVPEANLLISTVSGMISKRYINNPLTRLREKRRDRQRISEFLQVMHQMLLPNTLMLDSRVTFSPPVKYQEILERFETIGVLEGIKEQARAALAAHEEPNLAQPLPAL